MRRLPRVRARLFGDLLLLPVIVLLAACAGPAQVVGPWDFRLHATDDPFFNLHWRLDRGDGVVRAVGLVEAARVNGVSEVLLELVGLDARGRVVSRGLGRTYGGRILPSQTRPFMASLRPTGREKRFDLRVWTFSWEVGRGGAR